MSSPKTQAPNPMSPKVKEEKKTSEATDSDSSQAISSENQKSKADLRRERKAIQEAQRLKKAGGKGQITNTTAPGKSENIPQQQNQPKVKSANEIDQSVSKLATSLKSSMKISSTNESSNSKTETSNVSNKSNELSSTTNTNAVTTTATVNSNKDSIKFETAPVTLKLTRKKDASNEDLNTEKPKLFHHFEKYKRDYSMLDNLPLDTNTIHPAFIKLGIQSAHDSIYGSNSRCIAFLRAFKEFINDYKLSNKSNKTISKDLESKLKPNINFLTQARPLSISMGNAIKEMKQAISHISNETTDSQVKTILNEEIEKFIDEKILLAGETICKYMLANNDIVISGTSYSKSKITNDDCLLVYGYSSLVTNVLIQASRKFPNLRVIIVDSRPKLRGKSLLEQLVKHDINCTYVLINGVSFVMNRVTKVILGAHALLANGYVMSAIGSSQIALVAKSFNVPVVVCCETYKFCEKVQTDALVNNELSNPLDLLKYSNRHLKNEKTPLFDWKSESKEFENLTILNLTYDVTPPDLISCVVTDMGMLPCTSVPVVLRLKNRDNLTSAQHKTKSNSDAVDPLDN